MKSFGVAVVVGLVAVILIIILLGWTGEGQAQIRTEKAQIAVEHTRLLAPLWLAVKRVLIGALGVAGASAALTLAVVAVVALLSTPNLVRITWLRSWLVKPTRNALYPALAEPDGQGHIRVISPVNERLAQPIAALTNGNVERLGGAGQVVKQLTNPKADDFALSEPPVDVEPAQTALQIDPVEKPHWLIVGQTGSGKSTATRYIMTQLSARYRCEFVIAEPGGIDWNTAASAVTQKGIAEAIDAVYQEFERRQETLRQADVAHISQLPGANRLPYVYLVVEEMEAVLDDLKVTDRGLQQQTLINLRQIARMGRKPGVGLIAVTQAARTDVFDSHVRTNLANVLLFRNGQGTAEMFRVGDRVTLPGLATGECYSLAHGHRLTFPLTARPVVPMSKLYKERQLQLPADAEADGLGADDQPSTPPAASSGTVLEPQNGRVCAVEAPYPGRTVPVPVPPQRIDRRRPTPVEAAAMRAHYARTNSKTAVCLTFYGYKNGDCWNWVEQALLGKI